MAGGAVQKCPETIIAAIANAVGVPGWTRVDPSKIHTLRSSLDNPRIACTTVESKDSANNPRIVRIRGLCIT